MAARSTTITKEEEMLAHRLLTDAINTLGNRIERTETDFLAHLQKVESKLDQIVDLTKTVAVLQNQTSQQTDQITEVRAQLRESSQKFDNSISRIHTRLDEIVTHQRDKLELNTKEFDIKFESLKAKSDTTDKELKQWLNRGWGAWAILVAVIGIINLSVYKWVDGIERDKTNIVTVLDRLQKDGIGHENKLNNIDTSVKELVSQVKKNSDSQRELEDLVRNKR